MNAHSVREIEKTADPVEGRLPDTEELRELSRDVHDRVAHSILTVLTSLELAELEREEAGPATSPSLARAKGFAVEALEEIRRLAARLRDMAERVSCPRSDPPSIADRVSNASDGSDESLEFVESADSRVAPTGDAHEVYDQLFLVVREAVYNAVTHARAERVAVDIRTEGHWINAVVEDDGSGFEPRRLQPAKSVGLISMHERTVRVGGRFDIASSPCRGTRITIGMPLRRVRREHDG